MYEMRADTTNHALWKQKLHIIIATHSHFVSSLAGVSLTATVSSSRKQPNYLFIPLPYQPPQVF
jgi:hypothetical protein